jgi:acid stress chaperone HdeB
MPEYPSNAMPATVRLRLAFSTAQWRERVMHCTSVVSGLILSLILLSGPIAQAQVTMDASKITCDQFVHSSVAPTRIVAAWLSGFYNGKQDNRMLDLSNFEANISNLQKFCYDEKNFKIRVMQAVEKLFGGK